MQEIQEKREKFYEKQKEATHRRLLILNRRNNYLDKIE